MLAISSNRVANLEARLKNFALDILKRGSKVWVEELQINLHKFFDTTESEISKDGSSSFVSHLQTFLFNLSKSLLGAEPALDPGVADSGPLAINLWLGLQLLPTVPILAFQPWLRYFFTPTLILSPSPTHPQLDLHSQVHAYCGFSAFLPTLLGTIASDKTGLQASFNTRQLGRTSNSLLMTRFFDIKKGELLCGYQPLAMRDAQTGSLTESNKQCVAKDYVTLSASLIVAHKYQMYDSISGDSGKITAVEKAN
ncbi:hypothetical protein F3Y22_tig00117034pilonHSYRG00162 [Hibiscus syriacus]|uniref:Uncharacterized protein n=1 Tax=Hibiscus syriacus TaxID=106335 RepID=A0A6A2WCR3_HIBSY|nr:hypothetical protein F3Y22_tig00117034pilonHSYRG00162 [Hibiscus syriacus]